MLRLSAPAKINLYLRILGKRPDGFHDLETIFERIDLADELTFEEEPKEIRLSCDHPSLSCKEDNLIVQAAKLLQKTTGFHQGARIHLTKRVPIAAGLGGGSSDAAATLKGLNLLWKLRLSKQELADLAAQLGSDVAFFLEESPFAIGRARGELCEPLEISHSLWHVLLLPDFELSTYDVYQAFDSYSQTPTGSLTPPSFSFKMVRHALINGSPNELAKGLRNDLEPIAIQRCPILGRLLSDLRAHGCLVSSVSGSGPAVFGLCKDQPHAKGVVKSLYEIGYSDCRVEIVQTDLSTANLTI
ncbi:MAG: 4-(cytidine 5'-diphospho)-2-C-methyl-D-erythritol kinase [Candidatus Omnitrophica bacterium]|nr:4-(cytidine 5'-diphospho)-2-C-methyl-D-erythritol kinase [Candidatus Omnitrophota bacterium]MBI2173746.1 4-(cytidine 5'-diphospho)-2-C-methyl-D-erythritol kinase [Candidatus Omnitrophota bacterium]MBI3009815.1 4-(cytidine 5'-diphospho)-2-C-methyl-D-erythritol kinase [Candidatus Omnitrophota bacterium]